MFLLFNSGNCKNWYGITEKYFSTYTISPIKEINKVATDAQISICASVATLIFD